MKDDPFSVLGVPRNATLKVIRARYLELAKEHHPDRAMHLSETERKEHEEQFKRIQYAYEFLTDRNGNNNDDNATFEHIDLKEWVHVWKGLHDLFTNEDSRAKVKSILKQTISNAVSQYAASMMSATNAKTKHTHVIPYAATMEEIHLGVKKKIKVRLQGKEQVASYVVVDCGKFPEYIEDRDDVTLKFKISIKGNRWGLFQSLWIRDLQNAYDLKTTLKLDLGAYLMGYTGTLTYFDNSIIDVSTSPFHDANRPLVFHGKGLRGKGTLYVYIEYELPKEHQWQSLSQESQRSFIDCLNQLNQ